MKYCTCNVCGERKGIASVMLLATWALNVRTMFNGSIYIAELNVCFCH